MREELLTPEIIKMAKSLKRQIVEITPHYICGSDSNMATFSIIYLNGSVSVDNELYYFGATSDLFKYDIYLQNMYLYEMLKGKMAYLRRSCQMAERNRLLFQYNDITIGQQYAVNNFIESINGKAKDGMRLTYLNDAPEYMMSSCSTMHPINKTNAVNITGYEYNDIAYLVRFDINKKNYVIHEYISYLYL